MIIIETPSQFETVEYWKSFLAELRKLTLADQSDVDMALINEAIKEAEGFLKLRAESE
jgi:hypothetical protein